jgi:Ca-activated chloride channel family protein
VAPLRVADVMSTSRPASRESFFVIFTLTLGKYLLDRSHFLLAPFVLFLGIAGFSRSLATERSPTSLDGQTKIAVTTELVLLPVKVTDARGTFVPGLQLQDFRVYEDRQLQKVIVFEQGDTPVTVGLVVDHSKSMGSKLPDVVTAVSSFAHSSNPEDEMFVVDFNDDVSIKLMSGKPFSNDPKDLEKALNAVSARGQTALYDAVSEGLHHLQYGHLEKKALIIISDGGDNASHLKYSQVLAQARQSQAVIYSIALVGSPSEEENPGVLRRLCRDTGGVAYFPGPGESVTAISKEIARDLREQYTLGYSPQKINGADSFRKVQVKTTAPGHGKLHVRTRPGYWPAARKQPTVQPGSGTR